MEPPERERERERATPISSRHNERERESGGMMRGKSTRGNRISAPRVSQSASRLLLLLLVWLYFCKSFFLLGRLLFVFNWTAAATAATIRLGIVVISPRLQRSFRLTDPTNPLAAPSYRILRLRYQELGGTVRGESGWSSAQVEILYHPPPPYHRCCSSSAGKLNNALGLHDCFT